MKKSLLLLIGFCSLILMSFKIDTVIDYLSVGTELQYNKEQYHLTWSSHPNDSYYKQEYIRKAEKVEHYTKMLMVEALKTNMTPEQVSLIKLNELNMQKKTNPNISFRQHESINKQNRMISFIITGGNIFEWNIYKYEQQQINNVNMIVLYAYSYRNYVSSQEDVNKFVEHIKTNEKEQVEIINKLDTPKIKLKN